MQSLYSSRVSRLPIYDSSSPPLDDLTHTVETATYWSCFALDAMISSGTSSPRMLPMREMWSLKVPCPPNATQFAFGTRSAQQATCKKRDMEMASEILVQGFDLYADIVALGNTNGRRIGRDPTDPWNPGSIWAKLQRRLGRWRDSQVDRLHYPGCSITSQLMLGSVASFACLNLLYYQRYVS